MVFLVIPPGAEYTIDYPLWILRVVKNSGDPALYPRSDQASPEEAAQQKKIIESAVQLKRYQFQELDVLGLQVNPTVSLSHPEARALFPAIHSLFVDRLEIRVSWQGGSEIRSQTRSTLDTGYKRLFNNLALNRDYIESFRRKRAIPESEKTEGFHPQSVGFDSSPRCSIPPGGRSARARTGCGSGCGRPALRPFAPRTWKSKAWLPRMSNCQTSGFGTRAWNCRSMSETTGMAGFTTGT